MSEPAPSPPIDPDIINRLAQAERAALARRFGEALGICGDVLASFPGLAVAHATRGAILAHSGALTEAAAALETAVRLDPGQPGWHGNLAGVNRLLCRLDDAVAGAREAVRLAPHEARTWLNLGKILDDLDERDEAIDCFIKTLQREPENAEGHLGIGQMLLAEGNYRAG